MPLIQSPSKDAIAANIQTEQIAGRSHKQAVAIALAEARKNGAHIPLPKNGSGSASMTRPFRRRNYIAAPDRRF